MPDDVRFGVFLTQAGAPVATGSDEDLDEDGHVPASGYAGRHTINSGNRVARLGQDVLRLAAEAVGREVALVVDSVIAGIEGQAPANSRSFTVGDLELRFGVKATLGAGKAIEALLTTTGEATVEVTLTLRQRPGPGT